MVAGSDDGDPMPSAIEISDVVPLGHNRTYSCNITEGSPVWMFRLAGGEDDIVFPSTNGHDRQGIVIPMLESTDQQSTLTIIGMFSTNNTVIKCMQFFNGQFRETEILHFLVYGELLLDVLMCYIVTLCL